MIISVSRRTDVPAFYSRWFLNRLNAGFVDIVNPFNPNQRRRVDLKPDAVDCIVFWTRNPRPLMQYLDQIDKPGYRYYFLFTITGYPDEFEANLPSLDIAIRTFKELSDRVGPRKVIWRYDPIVLSSITNYRFHIENFDKIASELQGSTDRCIISFVDMYRKVKSRLKRLSEKNGIEFIEPCPELCLEIASEMISIADQNDIAIQSCAEEVDLSAAGIRAGACIDIDLINRLFGLIIEYEKDNHQRDHCLCARSVDIGAYNTCGYRCVYCYADSSSTTGLDNSRRVDDNDESMARVFEGSRRIG